MDMQMLEVPACCVTGHREIPEDKVAFVKKELRREILDAYSCGIKHYISGFAEGADLLFAEIVIGLMEQYPDMTLEAAIPYQKRLDKLMAVRCTRAMLEQCSVAKAHSEEYFYECYMKRNRYMAVNSMRIIAVYDGRSKGGTVFTMREGTLLQRDVRTIKI